MAHGLLRYPTLAEVIAIHEKVMRGLGEPPRPLREERLLESALTRPQMAAYYEVADIIRQATLLGTGISQARALLDGNKRTAFQTLDALLWVNGWEYVGDPLDLARQFERFAERSNETDEAVDAFEAWLRQYVQRRSDDR
jgi:prophage maintenance system killer protein